MNINKITNQELGLDLNYWNGVNKKERVFIAAQIMKQLGYKGGNDTLKNYNLIENIDKVTLKKKKYPGFFTQLNDLKSVGQRAGSVIMLYESGVWKLILQSKKQIGIKTRNWLAGEVLPSIKEKGYYDVSESRMNPFSYLNDFSEEKKQKQNSKLVAVKVNNEKSNYGLVYNQIHKLVVNMTAKEIKEKFKSKESARDVLRKHLPTYACTESVVDYFYTQQNKTLEEIRNSKVHKTLPPAFESLYRLGFRLD